ncbi:OBSCN [Bugula neritina]|uniref:OBSCN n=1 Tax=Bugula neritina TaxID=10212 RepID=A0A7J7J7K9_BUGNE|nr:OBSCN [Bugula neritina]
MVLLEESPVNKITSVTDLIREPNLSDDSEQTTMTYNEWRNIRRRRKLLYKAPVCKTRLESMQVQPGYSIKLTVEITGYPQPLVTWYLDNEELEDDPKFTVESNEKDNTYSLIISQISSYEAGCYQCRAENSEGADRTLAFISVKDTSRQRRKRSVSQRPHISTIRECRSREDAEKLDLDPKEERLLLRNRQCWDWWNLNAASDDEKRVEREQSCDLLDREEEPNSKTEKEWESSKHLKTPLSRTRSRSLPPEPKPSTPVVVEDKMKRLKSFWESKRHR